MNDNFPYVSFIIPALNEESNIPNTINSIKVTMHDRAHEIIVVDNGSTDETRSLAQSAGSIVLHKPEVTIASLRNRGVEAAQGEILVFLDADVTLAPNWCENLKKDYPKWPDDHLIITGSRCLTPDPGGFVEKNWFKQLNKKNSNYINSGHLVTTRKMHSTINGFDEHLRTAEDHDYCQRAINKNGRIRPNSELEAYHHGYPTTILRFMAREAWHGKEDMSSFSKFVNSKTALLATTNCLLLALSPLLYVAKDITGIWIAPLLLSMTLCLMMTPIKFGKLKIKQWLKTALCFQFYLTGRGAAIFFTKRRPSART